ncbi:MAG: hypothetical protein CM15mV82_490 [uncultured marine virus]|nr:MAG: hypothetical protein CM15mV82_490 [uncultured marine virus]
MLNKLKKKKKIIINYDNKNIYNNIPKHLKHLSVEKLKALRYLLEVIFNGS